MLLAISPPLYGRWGSVLDAPLAHWLAVARGVRRRASEGRERRTTEDDQVRVVTLGSDMPHPLTRAALSVIDEFEDLEHIDHLTANDQREFLRDARSEEYHSHIAALEPDLL